MKKILTLTVLFAVLVLVIFYSCTKTGVSKDDPSFTDPDVQMDISLAKEFYEKLRSETGDEVTEIHVRRNGDNRVNRKVLFWQKAYQGQTDTSTFVEVPLAYNKRPSDIIVSNNDASPIASANTILNTSFDRLLISKNNKTGSVQAYIVTYIPDNAYLKGRKDISGNQINALENDFSGFLKYRTWEGMPLFLDHIREGKLKMRMVPDFNKEKKPATARSTAGNARANDITCTGIYCDYQYVQNCYTSISGDYVTQWCGDWQLVSINCWSQCTDTGGGGTPGGDPGGGGGGGGGNPDPNPTNVPFVNVNQVTNNLTSPCFGATFNTITDTRVKSFLTNLYMSTFVGMDKVHNLRIEELPNLQAQGQDVPARSFKDPNDPSTWVIQLNSSYATQGSQEAWAQTIYHELIHGFIKMNDLDFTSSSTWQQEHVEMLTDWIDIMTNALMETYMMNWVDATGLALGGIEDVFSGENVSAAFLGDMNTYVQNHYGMSINAANQIQINFTSGTSGIRCN